MFLGILTMITALCISAVAIYYSVAGLVAIFAAAAVPIMIMGGTLEVAKLVTAVWLHYYWRETTWWLKSYLTVAVVVLMFITSMGIFGFLSRAHIEQTASANESVAQIERIETEISRQQTVIARAEERIETARSQDLARDNEIQTQIDREQERIDSAYQRIDPAIQEQQAIIAREQSQFEDRIQLLQTDVDAIDTELESLRTALSNGDVRLAQGIVGVRQDGALGPNTERAIESFRVQRQQTRQNLLNQIEGIRAESNPAIDAARTEIARLRSLAEQQIADSNQLINRLREQLGQTDLEQIEQTVQEQQTVISEANQLIDQLTEQKYELETEYRLLEAEVGPVKYLAEFVYGETADKDLLEEAVRWVIVIIIFVFDPLAVLLLIASQYTFELNAKKRKQTKTVSEKLDEATDQLNDIQEEVDELGDEVNEIVQEMNQLFDEELPQEEIVELYTPQNDFEKQRTQEYKLKDSEESFKQSKHRWKEENPNETIKMYKKLYIQGKIDKLPWEE